MRAFKFWLLTIALAGLAVAQSSGNAPTARTIRAGASLPSVCSTASGNVFFKTTSTVGLYQCLTPNTWTLLAAGAGGTGDFSSNTATSVVGEMLVFADTGGKLGKRMTGTGLVKITSGVAAAATAGTDYENPLTFNAPLSRSTNAISVTDAAADGSTKGVATFTAADFNASSGNISIDYTNGQKATGSVPGFLAAADFSTFNAKGDASTNTSSSVDGEMWLFSGTGGKTGKRSTLSGGILKSTSGVPAIATAGTDYSAPGTAETSSANRTFTAVVDASGASRTAPAKVGTSLPGTCTVGDLFFKSDATAGQNIYECTATNTWTQQLNSGGGSSAGIFASMTGATSSFSATPTFSLADVSSKSPVRFEPGAMTANVSSVTFSNKTAGAKFSIAWLQDGTGSRTVTYGASASNTCTVAPDASSTTTQQFEVAADGTTVLGTGCTNTTSSFGGPEQSAIGTPAASNWICEGNSTNHNLACKFNNSATVKSLVIPDTGASNNFLTAIAADGTISKAQPSVSNLSGFATNMATFLGTSSSANLRATITDETGTGLLYFQGGDAGAPSALLLTNATGLPTAGLASNAVTSPKLAVVNTYRFCDILVGDTSGSALTNAQLGPQKRLCYIPFAATIVEIAVSGDAGTPNVIIGKNTAGTQVNLTSSALATATSGGIACSNTGGTTSAIDGVTTCSSTLQNTSVSSGAYLELVSGTAGGTAKLMTIHVVYTVN